MEPNISTDNDYFCLAIKLFQDLYEFKNCVIQMNVKQDLNEQLNEIIYYLKDVFRDPKNSSLIGIFKTALQSEYEQFGEFGDTRELIYCILSLVHECCQTCNNGDGPDLCPSHQYFSYFFIKEQSETEGYNYFGIVVDTPQNQRTIVLEDSKYIYINSEKDTETEYKFTNFNKFLLCSLDYEEDTEESLQKEQGNSFYSSNFHIDIKIKKGDSGSAGLKIEYDDRYEYLARWLILWNGRKYHLEYLENELNEEELENLSNQGCLKLIVYKRFVKNKKVQDNVNTIHEDEENV